MVCYTISATKANRLYWLGRYTERVYTSLHLLRRCYDKMIDGSSDEYEMYYHTMDVADTYPDIEAFKLGLMYDSHNPASLISGLERAMDNAIVLRREIMSETLGYVEMAMSKMKAEAEKGDTNITNLQTVTDCLLSFWGSLDERIDDGRVRNFLIAGRLTEYLDMRIRFRYSWKRVGEFYRRLKHCAVVEGGLFDTNFEDKLDEMLKPENYNIEDDEYRNKLLKCLNQLILL